MTVTELHQWTKLTDLGHVKFHGFVGNRWITTSLVAEALDDRTFRTSSGSVYRAVGDSANGDSRAPFETTPTPEAGAGADTNSGGGVIFERSEE